jgi:hypothetical protein
MSLRRWRRRLVVAAALLLGATGLVYGYGRFASTRYLIDAKLASLPSGRSILVVQELIGSSSQNSQTLRFDFLDPASGERLERTSVPLSVHGTRLRFLGGEARQWWGQDGEIVQVDAEKGTVELGLLPADLAKARREPELPRLASGSAHFTSHQRPAAPTQPPGELALACYSMTEGPCTLGSRSATEVLWQLGDAELDGNSVLAVEARDAQRAYVYVANDGMLSMLIGGVYLYAVELDTGRIAWKKKL